MVSTPRGKTFKEAVQGETHKFKEMYPEMIEAAKAEGQKAAERSLPIMLIG